MAIVLATTAGLFGCGAVEPDERPSARERAAVSSGGGISSASVTLQERTAACANNQQQTFYRIKNTGTTPIPASDLSIKLWVDDTSASNIVPRINTGGCLTNATGCFHQVTGVTATATRFSPACGPDASHQANWEITITTTDHTPVDPGVTWDNLQTALSLANFANFSPGTSKWYSGCLPGSSYTSDPHYAVYVRGAEVPTPTGLASPTCRAPHGRQQLTGYVVAPASTGTLVGPAPADTVMQLAIGLPSRDAPGLSAFADAVSDPANPSFRHFKTPAEVAASFGPSQTDYQALVAWAQANGLTVHSQYPNRLLLDVGGTVANIERALFTNMVQRKRPDGTLYLVPDREPSLDLDPTILRISGLSTFAVPHSATVSGTCPVHTTGTADSGYYGPGDIRAAYTKCERGLTGQGQSVGILAFEGFRTAPIGAYQAHFGLQVPILPVLANDFCVAGSGPDSTVGPCFRNGIPFDAWIDEVALDVEMVAAMAPGISQVVAFAGSEFSSIYEKMATTEPLTLQISSSFSSADSDDNERQILKVLAAQGQSLFQASGDFGAENVPSSDTRTLPFTTLVGMTNLTTTGSGSDPGNYVCESTSTGGSGILGQPIPAYQQGIDMSTNGGSTTQRNFPDVSLLGEYVAAVIPEGSNNVYEPEGGTSVSAPLWAAFMALVNQRAQAHGLPPVGFANPALYAIGKVPALYDADFNDITDGNNGGIHGGFNAVPGYDLTTGLGTPRCQLIAQLGSAAPSVPPGPTVPVSMDAGTNSACAVLSDGSVKCWGRNTSGQLGDGTVGDDNDSNVPVNVQGLTGPALAVSVGDEHACALLADRTVMCWGDDSTGELGDGNVAVDAVPHAVAVDGLTNAVGVSAGTFHTCAVLANGAAYCWGSNDFGESGSPPSGNVPTPQVVVGFPDVVSSIDASGRSGTCALVAGKMLCWGLNDSGQLGLGTADGNAHPTPTEVPGLSGVEQISVGFEYACAVQGGSGGKITSCWGNNENGQLGDGTSITRHSPVTIGIDAASVAAGPLATTCAVTTNSGVSCWGLGFQIIPFGVGAFGATATSAGSQFGCALMNTGEVNCWGANGFGQLGDGTNTASSTPVKVQL